MNEAGYEYCAAFFASMAGAGVRSVVVSPGSRSTPLTLSAHAVTELEILTHHDERSAAFLALGLAKAGRTPVALICTSGTAAANYLPAVAEAYFAAVPLLVLSADRPPELRGWGAGQTIDQVGLYGTHARWAAELPVPDESSPVQARAMARRAVAAAWGPTAGPVHLNWPLRKPLEPEAPIGPLPATGPPLPNPSPTPSGASVERLVELAATERGVIVAGPTNMDAEAVAGVAAFAGSAGWPVLADASSQLRTGAHVDTSPIISTAHHLLGCEPFESARPDVVLRLGAMPSSSAVERWLGNTHASDFILLEEGDLWREPTGSLTERIQAPPGYACQAASSLLDSPAGDWSSVWVAANEAAASAIAGELEGEPLTEPSIVTTLGAALDTGSILYASNSMPIRDVDMFLPARSTQIRVLANRGANGIDGITSSAMGAAHAAAGPVTLLTGDLALLHDAGGLLAAARLGIDLTLVVPNNDGGGIFSYLPIANALGDAEFDELFHTPHGRDLSLLSAAAGAQHSVTRTRRELTAALAAARTTGLHVIEVPIEVSEGVAQHRRIEGLVSDAVGGMTVR